MSETFARIFKEWDLRVRSMQYQKDKGRIPQNDLERFRKLEERMDAEFRALPPFAQEDFWSECQEKKRRAMCRK